MEVREPSAKYLSRPSRVLTSAGELPADWIVQPLGELMRLLNGRAFRPDEWSDTGAPIIRIQNLNDPDSDFNFFSGVVDERNVVRPGDLLFAWSGTTGSSFGARVWTGPEGVLNQHIFKVLPDPRKLSSAFAYRLLVKAQYSIERQAHGFKASFVHVKKSDLVSVSAGYPPTLKEQDRIAESLANADALIDSLEQLLTKKRQIKQGAMQELLTGKQRLPGFRENWDEATFADIALIDPENLGSGTRADFAFNYIALEGVDQGRLVSFTETQFDGAPSRARRVLREGDVLVATVRPNLKSHLLFDAPHGHWIASTGFSVVRCKEGTACPGFLFALLFSSIVERQIDALLTGSNYPAINGRDVANLAFARPPFEEQVAIAQVLSDMDAEITALESRLTKARALKQAMAQALLTGKIRLI